MGVTIDQLQRQKDALDEMLTLEGQTLVLDITAKERQVKTLKAEPEPAPKTPEPPVDTAESVNQDAEVPVSETPAVTADGSPAEAQGAGEMPAPVAENTEA